MQTPIGFAYYVAKERTNWVDAQRICKEKQSHLAYAGLRMNNYMYQ